MVAVVGVGAGDPDAATWLNGLGVTFPAVADTDWTITTQYWNSSSSSYPQNTIVGRNEIVQDSITGLHDEATLEGHLLDVIWMRDPISLEMVMDVSDSMNSPSPSDPGGDSKLTMMRQASKIITDFLKDQGQADDGMGLVWFTDNASEYIDPTGEKLLLVQTNADALKGQIDAHGAGICTAMGAGLQTAFNTLITKPSHRFAILCTDGMQNIEPKVTKVGDHYEIIDSGGWLCGPHSSTPPCPGDDITLYNTRVNAIGVGIESSYAALLQDLANATGGFYLGTNDPEIDLDLIYFVDLCNCMAGGSPAVVLHSPAKLYADQCTTEEHFSLNRTVRKLTVVLSWKKALDGSLTFWLYAPDGTLLNLHQEMEFFETYAKSTIYLPKFQDGRALQNVGQWRMVIAGQFVGPYADYHAIVIAEDRVVKYHLEYPKKVYSVGEILPIRILLEESEKPIQKIREIAIETAQLAAPLPELIAQYTVSGFEINQKIKCAEPSKDPFILKLKAMTSDPIFQDRLKPVRKLLSLQQGAIRPEVSEREILIPFELNQSGLQTFKVMIQAETPKDGPVQRVNMISILVNPGQIHPKCTAIVSMERSVGKMKGLLLRVTPRNNRRQLLGPGYTSEFEALIEKKVVKVEVEDLLDGSYQIEMLFPEREWIRLRKERKALELTFHKIRIWEYPE